MLVARRGHDLLDFFDAFWSFLFLSLFFLRSTNARLCLLAQELLLLVVVVGFVAFLFPGFFLRWFFVEAAAAGPRWTTCWI